MDQEPATLLEQQGQTIEWIAASIKRQGDTLTIMSRQVVEILNLLTPQTAEGETALERLLAQLVAQGQEQLRLLRSLAGVAEGDGKEPLRQPGSQSNGHGKRSVS